MFLATSSSRHSLFKEIPLAATKKKKNQKSKQNNKKASAFPSIESAPITKSLWSALISFLPVSPDWCDGVDLVDSSFGFPMKPGRSLLPWVLLASCVAVLQKRFCPRTPGSLINQDITFYQFRPTAERKGKLLHVSQAKVWGELWLHCTLPSPDLCGGAC